MKLNFTSLQRQLLAFSFAHFVFNRYQPALPAKLFPARLFTALHSPARPFPEKYWRTQMFSERKSLKTCGFVHLYNKVIYFLKLRKQTVLQKGHE